MEGEAGGSPPTSMPLPTNGKTQKADAPNHCIISRQGFGTSGRLIPLLSNHFNVSVNISDVVFYQYSVCFTSEDKRDVQGKGIGRKIVNRLYQTYSSELGNKWFAYDGEGTLYSVGPLPQTKLEFTVVLEESFAKCEDGSLGVLGSLSATPKRSKRSFHSKTFKVEISYAAKIPLKSVVLAPEGIEANNSTQDAQRVLDTILRQQAANRGCLLVKQSFFHDDSKNFTDVEGGLTGVHGFHSSFCTTHGGLSLNMDVSTTVIITPGPVIDFLLANQNVREPRYIDWVKAKRVLKNLRIKPRHRDMEFKIIGLSEKPCNQQFFCMKVKNSDNGNTEAQTVDVTVYEYFTRHCGIELTYSAFLPCLDVGKPKRPNYLPVELCSLVSLQRYAKALSSKQKTSLVEKSRQKPLDRIRTVVDAVRNYCCDNDSLLSACGISIEKKLTHVHGRVLETPKLKVGNSEDCVPCNGRWSFKNKTLWKSITIERWAVVNFSARCDTSKLSRDLIDCGRNKGMQIERPYTLIEEDPQSRRGNAVARVDKMFEQVRAKLPGAPQFILCVLPERKNSDIYGPWKKKCLSDFGIVTQCISPLKIDSQYLTNVLLKINSKLGGINSLLEIEHLKQICLVMDIPTMILGMDVSHGSPGHSNIPSVAAVVGSRHWPLISRYRASVRTQSPKVEMIEDLFKPVDDKNDDGIMRELLLDFYQTSNGRKPKQIILFRDGVSESQFNQVLDIEVEQIKQAYQHLGGSEIPKFTVIIAQKNHHTKLFQANAPENVPAGTVVDTKIVHPRNYDFYMCSHGGMIGTSRPAHYIVLLNEIGFSPDELQNLIHSLCYVYQRSSSATSIVAPICYAHLAARQMGKFITFDDSSETSSGDGSMTSAGTVPVTELPKLHEEVEDLMFFC